MKGKVQFTASLLSSEWQQKYRIHQCNKCIHYDALDIKSWI